MNEINIHRGRSKTIKVTYRYKDGTSFLVPNHSVFRFAVKEDANGEAILKKILEWDPVSGTAVLTLIPSDTSGLEVSRYFYDIGIDFPDGGYKDIISWSEFNVLPSAAGKE